MTKDHVSRYGTVMFTASTKFDLLSAADGGREHLPPSPFRVVEVQETLVPLTSSVGGSAIAGGFIEKTKPANIASPKLARRFGAEDASQTRHVGDVPHVFRAWSSSPPQSSRPVAQVHAVCSALEALGLRGARTPDGRFGLRRFLDCIGARRVTALGLV